MNITVSIRDSKSMFRRPFIFLLWEHLSKTESRSVCIVLRAPALYWRHVDEEPSLQPDGSTNPRPCTSLPALICAVTCRLSPWPRVIVGASLVVATRVFIWGSRTSFFVSSALVSVTHSLTALISIIGWAIRA